MITIEYALKIAIEAHEGQKDLDGNPVILHPMTVAVFNAENLMSFLITFSFRPLRYE